jgi:hypothetical protein
MDEEWTYLPASVAMENFVVGKWTIFAVQAGGNRRFTQSTLAAKKYRTQPRWHVFVVDWSLVTRRTSHGPATSTKIDY